MFVISMAAEKGGIGKSTISAMLAQVMSYADKRVLLFDLDQQADSSAFMNLPKEQATSTIVDLFAGRCDYKTFVKNGGIRKSGNCSVSVITGSIHLIDLYGRLAADKTISEVRKMVDDNFRLLIKELSKEYDFVFVDFPPGIDTIWESILQISSQIIVPITPHLMSMQSAVKSAVILVAHGISPDKITIVPNQITASSSHKKDLDLIKEKFSSDVYVANNYIPQSSSVERILEYDQNLFVKWFGNKEVRGVIEAFCSIVEEMYGVNKRQILMNLFEERKKYMAKYLFT